MTYHINIQFIRQMWKLFFRHRFTYRINKDAQN